MINEFLKEFELEKNDEFRELSFNYSVPNHLEIITPNLPKVKAISELLYSIFNRLNYLFNFLDYQITVQKNSTIDKKTLQDYFSFIFSTPFLWKDKKDLVFFCEQSELLESFTFRRDIVYLTPSENLILDDWRNKLTSLKEILGKLGLSNIRFAWQQNKKEKESINSENNKKEVTRVKKSVVSLTKNSLAIAGKKILQEWKGRKIFELGIHTNFSTLDGISSPTDYLNNAQEKNYAALAVTDHCNVQAFPEFSNNKNKDLKVIYGCEMEMLEDELPPYIFNHSEEILKEDINGLTYCVFDLETTGFFSEHNEIIEIGYTVYRQGETIREGEYLICPEKEFSPEILKSWYTSIDPEELKKAPKIKEILLTLVKDWEGCVLVAHNAGKFDYGFLDKVWKDNFGTELPYPVIDTLVLSWIAFPERKSYSLEKLSNYWGRAKVTQTHRALDDTKLLTDLLEKLLKILKENNVNKWGEVKGMIRENFFPNRGSKVKVLATNQQGLNNLYRLITISHTTRLFKKPSILRSDLEKFRQGLLLGGSGSREGEIFSLFSSFNSDEVRRKNLKFYDYIEVNNPETFRHLWLNGQVREKEIKEMMKKVIEMCEELKIPVIPSNQVYYCESKERLLKEIIVANEGMNGNRHYLYSQATFEDKEDRFSSLPPQHLLTLKEIIDNWVFLSDKNLIERLIFKYPQDLVNKIGEVKVQQPSLNYSMTKSIEKEENDLVKAYTQKANEIFGKSWPDFVKERLKKEWQIIKGRYVFIYWLAYKVVSKTYEDKEIVGSRGSIGSSFVAFLCGITDLNPLPFYYFCPNCHYAKLYQTNDRVYSSYDYQGEEKCPNCSNLLTMEGHNLPFETFFGWEGEKTPDIDLNFSGEYQKVAHNYVRELLGEDSVYRIGTINTLSQQTAEIFWREHAKLRKKLNSNFSEENWFKEWVNGDKIKDLESKLFRYRHEKNQLEAELKKLEGK
ncbi:MAG: DNA polymerase III PolC-type [Mycoplasmataceae bacterium]|nr:MAG: DNA polymerase III PolC-type [Mycoplasmataceae bacterium]